MRSTTPQVFLISKPALDWAELERFLTTVGGTAWAQRVRTLDAPDGENLVEAMGRLCYRSWAPGLNPNVGKVREDSRAYLDNILSSRHGSVLEHASYSFVFHDVSRVFTHELVRHRAGVAISQESLRYVRLDDIPFAHPDYVRENPRLLQAADDLIRQMESFQQLTVEETGINAPDTSFHTKKTVTSAARRYAPDGLSTTIGWTVNVRALRHVIAARTDPAAEAEIRQVFDTVAAIMTKELPSLLGDFIRADDGTWTPTNDKV